MQLCGFFCLKSLHVYVIKSSAVVPGVSFVRALADTTKRTGALIEKFGITHPWCLPGPARGAEGETMSVLGNPMLIIPPIPEPACFSYHHQHHQHHHQQHNGLC